MNDRTCNGGRTKFGSRHKFNSRHIYLFPDNRYDGRHSSYRLENLHSDVYTDNN